MSRLLDTFLEGWQIDLLDGTLRHIHVHRHAVYLMVVEEEMLQTASHPIRLGSLDIGHSHLTCQIGVFTHILETAAIEGAAGDGGARAEHDVLAAIGKLLAHLESVEAGEFAVPGGGETGEGRKSHNGVVGPVGIAP